MIQGASQMTVISDNGVTEIIVGSGSLPFGKSFETGFLGIPKCSVIACTQNFKWVWPRPGSPKQRHRQLLGNRYNFWVMDRLSRSVILREFHRTELVRSIPGPCCWNICGRPKF